MVTAITKPYLRTHVVILKGFGFPMLMTGELSMSSAKQDDIKGRGKEATGAITGDDKLKREGRKDQAAGKVKEKVEKVVDKVKDATK